jgi:aromatic ring hydroxylase
MSGRVGETNRGRKNLVAYQRHMRDADLSTTHALINPQGRPLQARRPSRRPARSPSTRSARPRTRSSCGAAGCSPRSPHFADDLLIYPGSDIRPQDGRYALSFAVPIATPGLKFICRDSYSKQRPAYDYPLSSRFDEMDCVVIFDDVEVPKERVFLDGDTVGYSEVISDTGWRGHIMHQAFTRAYVKLCFAFGLGHVIANTIGVVPLRPHPGEARSDLEHVRAHPVGHRRRRGGLLLDEGGVWYPDDRSFLALRGEMPKWLPRANELLQLIGGGGYMCTPSRADLDGPLRPLIDRFYQAAGADAERRVRLFRLAWDFLGSDLGGRGELYERFYLSDSWRMTALAYSIADKSFAESLVEQFLQD